VAINRIDPVYLNEVYLSGLTGSPITLNRTSLHRHMRAYKHRDGYRRLHILLRREGLRLNHKRLFRLYREERLGVRKRGGRKRALGTRSAMALSQGTEPALVFGLCV
jgi:hypothetical protein